MLKRELYEIARRLHIEGRSTMKKADLEKAVFSHPDVRKAELYKKAQAIDLEGRSQMTKDELRHALVGPELTEEDYDKQGRPVLYRVVYDGENIGYCTSRHRAGVCTMLYFHGPDLHRTPTGITDKKRLNRIMPTAPNDAVILDPPR